MADRLDKLLSDYFTGRLEMNMKMRKLELKYNFDRTPDENIGGGRKQNDYNNAVETSMIREQNDGYLKDLQYQKDMIEMMLSTTVDCRQRVLVAKYGRHETWTKIAFDEHVDERTVRAWRDDFKEVVGIWLGESLKPTTHFRPTLIPA
ncbi:DUF722 domain-containing protein [Weissella thailandensis]|uniref:DUF722 domain-containing protein n=1 Tax=Weissella thailandensis TaxID=89061 RepID=A0ABX9I536_9LACO|nr:DUF722 domain-containing protein [Weissella thailandensis]NKY90850.1 DUF722 domain-containing protein [Weissella thailandensis]RDS59647.1 DUF722 domain-containing protein [Weissella thailandensis]GEP75477.1 hypothetical protein WTH01_17240 [Weissella thailandensis]